VLNGRVIILSASPETLDSVQAYLVRVGATALGASRLEDAPKVAVDSDVLLVFADDYRKSDVLSLLASFPTRRCVVVTSDVETYRRSEYSRDRPVKLVVLRRPAWGWVLLDALRVDGGAEDSDFVQT
jgi:hypothetical protein